MKLLLLFLVVCLVAPSFEWRRRWRFRVRLPRIRIRWPRVITTAAVLAKAGVIGKRDLPAELQAADVNNDGKIDESEAETLFNVREAEDLMTLGNEYDTPEQLSQDIRTPNNA